MGLNVMLYAKGNVTREERLLVEKLLDERIPGFLRPSDEAEVRFGREVGKLFGRYSEDEHYAYTWHRFYGPGYERGDWPTIAAAISLLRHALPGRAIRYGSDARVFGDTMDDRAIQDMWAYWVSDAGDHYWSDARRRGLVWLG